MNSIFKDQSFLVIEPIRNDKYVSSGAYAMGLQEWCLENLHHLKKTIVFPYICDPHVQIGRFQNPDVEINYSFLKKHNIEVVRRSTGGGAIFIDKLAVAFCFLVPINSNNYNSVTNYKDFYEPIIKHLKDMGASSVQFSGKNDLTIDGKKISGAAMRVSEHFLYGGFSLLYDIDFEKMVNVLRPNRKKIESKGIKSIKQRVTRIKDYLKPEFQNLNIFEFKNEILKRLNKADDINNLEYYIINEQEWKEVDQIVNNKYKNWEWTYGLSPRYNYNREERFDKVGTVNISLSINEYRIEMCKISGDFFVNKNLTELEEGLIGTKMTAFDLSKKLDEINFSSYFNGLISIQQIVDLILS